ncbi:hypothetical protein [Streptomyces caniscabiei]|uniref:Uncharacterized protein n=1 Tax=Streptomyces caniscabiei TaxID=2746961 RepID=A0ABU4N0N5_9ACTN|nr:hypothetical protein [Streptomyces caniscabiei]MBE4790329.1 hypothetical protein [Streptomyces caniscabiei]MBE4799442.1 hypothetical protein [Streptomyces caniscabiei]MDX3015186.1 hypothetical protein [Streptomyces caniscabiei]MDX3042629.1 hypothetical protein [Streptomyces caniscabiei]
MNTRRRGKGRRRQQAQDPSSAGPREWDTTAAEREFARNKARIDAGATYRARQGTGWKLGGSPSTAGEIKR